MQITIDQAGLAHALRLIARAVPARPQLPILQHVLMDVGGGRLTMTATDPQWINDIDIQTTTSGSVRLYTAGWGGKCDVWDITNIATSAPVLLGSFSAGIDGSSASATAACPSHPPKRYSLPSSAASA